MIKGWIAALVARFWAWCEETCAEPDERDDEPKQNSKKNEKPRGTRGAEPAPVRRLRLLRGRDSHGCPGECTRTDPMHEYADTGTLPDFHWGNRCMNCGVRDDKRRPHNETRCVRPHLPELA